jgi:DNA modification methylase
MTHQTADGRVDGQKKYTPPAKSNPGNVIHCKVGGGLMGDPLAHDNEAPFPEALVEVFVKSFCPPDGIVFDPFMGSGTSLAVALKNGRKARGVDIRQSQVDLTLKRIGKLECSQDSQ